MQVVNNAKALADALTDEGIQIVSGGTDNHLMLVDLGNFPITGKKAQHLLDEVGITVNKNAVPYDTQKPTVTSGIRIGTPAVTTRGMKEEDMKEIAQLIKLTLTDFDNSAEYVRRRVAVLQESSPLPVTGVQKNQCLNVRNRFKCPLILINVRLRALCIIRILLNV